jgi:hypothetical protein
LVVRVVASLIVALGRERDAAIIFMDDLWFRVETCEATGAAVEELGNGRSFPVQEHHAPQGAAG